MERARVLLERTFLTVKEVMAYVGSTMKTTTQSITRHLNGNTEHTP
jgi:Uri superfamily endonuclease